MGTSATIAVMNDQGKIKATHVNSDGYQSHMAKVLPVYSLEENAFRLVDAGDASFIGFEFDYKERDWKDRNSLPSCEFYHRDRDEDWEDVKPREFETVSEWKDWTGNTSAYYMYLWKDGRWNIFEDDILIALTSVEKID